MTRPVAVAITGGIGAGKSEALRAFARHGAATVSSDEIVHELLRRDDVKQAVVERLGNGVVGPGRRDRPRRARRRSSSTTARRSTWLEAAAASARLGRVPALARAARPAAGRRRAVVRDRGAAALRGRRRERFDKVVVITAPTKLRRARSAVADRRARARLLPDAEKVARADFAYVNAGSLEELDAFVASVMDDLTRVRRLAGSSSALVVGLRPARSLYVDRDEPAVVRAAPLPAALRAIRRASTRARTSSTRRCSRRSSTRSRSSTRDAPLVLGRDRADAADARDGAGDRDAHGRLGVPDVSDLYDPEINIRYGSWYLHNLFKKYGNERLVLAAYNAGQGNVDRWRAKAQPIQFAETRAYVERVEHLKHVYRDAWGSKLYPDDDRRRRSSSSPRTPTRTRRSGRPTSGSSPTATCSGWAAATSRAGTSRSASASRADEVDEVRAEIHAHLRANGRTALHLGGRLARDSGRPRRPALGSGWSTTSPTPLAIGHGADRAAGAGAARVEVRRPRPTTSS